MKFRRIVFMGLMAVFSQPTWATVLTFDDVAAQGQFNGNTYKEWAFNEAGIFTGIWPAAAVSGSNYITNFNTRVGVFSRATSFDFDGAHFTADGRYPGANSVDVLVSGLNSSGGTLFSRTINLSAAPQFISFDWKGIYGISWDPISGASTNNVGIDNFTYNSAASNDVPEPATLGLVGLSLAGIGLSRRKR